MKKVTFVLAIFASAALALAGCHHNKGAANAGSGSGSAMGSDTGSAAGSDMGSGGSAMGSDMGSGGAAGSGSAM